MPLPEHLKQEIIQRLAPLMPEKVILFGSYAAGVPTEDSDIDLYVVTHDDFMPKTWQEKSDISLQVSQAMLDFRMQHAVDLIVHTRPMHDKFMQMGSSFAKELQRSGVRLI
jgi:predicted nucleotidyltransferase